MANTNAISCICKALLKSFEEACPKSAFVQTPEFEIYQPESFATTPAKVVKEGFTVMVWRVAPNAQLRNRAPRKEPGDTVSRRPSLPVDIHLLVTPWATESGRQLGLLGWVMRHLEDLPGMDAGRLNAGSGLGEDCFRSHEMVEIVSDPLSISDQLGLWDKFKPRLPPSATYVARGVLLDSELPVSIGAPVVSRDIKTESVKGAGA